MQVARPAAGRAHRKLPGQRRFGGRRERRGLLVANVLPGKAARPAHRISESIQRVTRDPVHPAHARCLQHRHRHVGHTGSHDSLLEFPPPRVLQDCTRIYRDSPCRTECARSTPVMRAAENRDRPAIPASSGQTRHQRKATLYGPLIVLKCTARSRTGTGGAGVRLGDVGSAPESVPRDWALPGGYVPSRGTAGAGGTSAPMESFRVGAAGAADPPQMSSR